MKGTVGRVPSVPSSLRLRGWSAGISGVEGHECISSPIRSGDGTLQLEYGDSVGTNGAAASNATASPSPPRVAVVGA